MPLPCRVIKVGGSLLSLPELPVRLSQWIISQPPAANVLIAGGGTWCNAVRNAEGTHGLSVAATHWISIRALHTTAGLLAELMQYNELVSYSALMEWRSTGDEPRQIVFNVSQFLLHEEAGLPGRSLAVTAEVTSDAIAARVAEVLRADELVLMKSREGANFSLQQLAERGIVDADFPQAAASCAMVRVVNLRGV